MQAKMKFGFLSSENYGNMRQKSKFKWGSQK